MTTVCILGLPLATASPVDIIEHLVDGVESAAEGHAVMRWLLNHRVDAANDILCRLYDIACYRVGDSCFKDSASPDHLDKWFVRTPVDSAFPAESIPLADNLVEAQALAVSGLALLPLFFSEATSS